MASVLTADGLESGRGAEPPCVIGAAGIHRQLLLTTSREEQRMLERSAAVLEATYHSLTTPPSQLNQGAIGGEGLTELQHPR